jgi:type IV secretory pathway VirB2 component (pilin)
MAEHPVMTAAGNKVGLSWPGVESAVQHALNLLQGPTAATCIDIVKTLMVGIQAATGKDLVGVFAAMNQERVDITALVAAIKAEFDLG